MLVNLDPENWENIEKVFNDIVHEGLQYIRNIDKEVVWREAPKDIKEKFLSPLPNDAMTGDELEYYFNSYFLPYSNGNKHPNFFGWVHGGGNVYGALGELSAALLNNNLGGRNQLANDIERQVISWVRELFGFKPISSGILTSGTSMATLIALTVARYKSLGNDAKVYGSQFETPNLVGYCSKESHNSIIKAFQILGLGSHALRVIPVDEDFTINTNSLIETIEEDIKNGLKPFCIIGTIGTVNTGAIDPVEKLLEIRDRYDIWLHIDAAFGGAVILLEAYRNLLNGIDQVDSIAFDFHKWFQVPYSVGCVLIQDSNAHLETFSERKEYLTSEPYGLSGDAPWFSDYGPELSRGFLALKVWFTFQGLGVNRIRTIVKKHCELAKYLSEKIQENDKLEVCAPVTMNIVCFRFIDNNRSTSEYLDKLNQAIVTSLQVQGLAAPSTTRVNGSLVIRVCIINHRTEKKDIERLVKDILIIGHRIHHKFSRFLQSTESLLIQNADTRLVLNPDTGLNRYGCSPKPRKQIYSFSTSTGTSVSKSAFKEIELWHQKLFHACVKDDSNVPIESFIRELEQSILDVLSLDQDKVEIFLSSSGTDAQLQVSSVVSSLKQGKWISVVVGSEQTGSGTPYSTRECHFDEKTSLDISVNKGQNIEGSDNIEFFGIEFTDKNGCLKSLDQVDQEIQHQVEDLISQGYNILLHVMDQSKYGCTAPSDSILDLLREKYNERLYVIIDACQLRLDSIDLMNYINHGDIVLITGSKFFGGPAFSGATLYPKDFQNNLLKKNNTLPVGLVDYMSEFELKSWKRLLPKYKSYIPIGMYLRWYGALFEMKRYYDIPKEERIHALGVFGKGIYDLISNNKNLHLVIKAEDKWWNRQTYKGDELSGNRTIFPFFVYNSNGKFLSQDQVKKLYELLNTDISDYPGLQDSDKELASIYCHIGQPVKIDQLKTSVLRISIGARNIIETSEMNQVSQNRLKDELFKVQRILDKIDLCLRVMEKNIKKLD